ncbi:MAG: peptidylprolyl isomerase [Candidatus Doudnabacteria bacterium]|nr:peptidylprolyl isomerase [Candidatus Doudnabacteria bacterium]
MDVAGFGKITLEFYEKDAPKTVENFLRLANAGYFDCLTFHRVAKGFVIQGGDPTGTGAGGESAFGGEFADEVNPASELYKKGYVKGVLAMANRGPNTNTSQFFIMLGDVPLPASYTIFGKVASGIEVVDKIGQVEIIPQMGPTDGRPKEAVVMTSVKIIK